MARSVSLSYHHYRDENKERDPMINELVTAVNENFATFRGWAEVNMEVSRQKTIRERFMENYQTFMNW